MTTIVHYYLAPQSPWTYLGHQRLMHMAQQAGAEVRVIPMDLGKVFPVSGGLPLGQRAPQRQAYRFVELERFSKHLQMPLHLKPQFFPVAGDDAARLIIAVGMHHGSAQAAKFAGAVLAAVWVQERNIADTQTLSELLSENQLDAACLELSRNADVQKQYDANTQEAIDIGVFGSPTYVIDGELFWGQDRLEFVSRKLLGK
jgi:2-hydroxychromene-2-carboxylate isomerase